MASRTESILVWIAFATAVMGLVKAVLELV